MKFTPRPTDIHVMPVTGNHVSSCTCPCGPRLDMEGPGGRLFVHTAEPVKN